jgi:CysZ protein
MPPVFLPITLAISQLNDPAFRGVLLRSLAWSVACLAALYAGALWTLHQLLALHGWLAWAVDIVGSIGALLLAFWLFLPVAVGIGTLYLDRIASAVERRFYPWLPQPESAPVLEQAWDGMVVALNVLALNVAALILALVLPGIGFILGWMIAAYAIGRGLFVAVAMRRMPRAMAESLYRRSRGLVLTQGAILALSAYVPVANLLIPVLGTATMVHILDMALSEAHGSQMQMNRQ